MGGMVVRCAVSYTNRKRFQEFNADDTIGPRGFCNFSLIGNFVSCAPLFNLVNEPCEFLLIIIRPTQHLLKTFLHPIPDHHLTISHPLLPLPSDLFSSIAAPATRHPHR